jgi:hypothetical protein
LLLKDPNNHSIGPADGSAPNDDFADIGIDGSRQESLDRTSRLANFLILQSLSVKSLGNPHDQGRECTTHRLKVGLGAFLRPHH